MPNNKCFYEVTNKQIYEKLLAIERKCTIASWTAGTALTLSIICIGVVITL